MNHKITSIQKKIVLVLATGLCTLFVVATAWAGNPSGVKNEATVTKKPVNLNSLVMYVDPAKSLIEVSEKIFEVFPAATSEFAMTVLTDEKGHQVKLDFFKKGQRVIVRGYELPNKRYIAVKIRLFSQNTDIRKDYRRIQKIKPIHP